MTSKTITKYGDLWLLGNHRLLCDNSTKAASLHKIMNGNLADLVFLDPPYNVNYRGCGKKRRAIAHDNLSIDDYHSFLERAFLACHVFMQPYASMYVFHASMFQREVQNALEFTGFKVRNQLVWVKNHFVLSRGRYHHQHEHLFYCHLKRQRDRWFGDRKQSTILKYPKPSRNRLHPTMKPVELIERVLQNSSQKNDIVLDTFAGAGSTLIACEQQQRRAYLIEIEPSYCDVIIERWQSMTGKKATLIQSKSQKTISSI